jgi:flagellar biosynthesis protein FlhB
MADESDLEKTEQPTGRRIEQAREEGQVPQSRELSTFFVLIAGVTGLWMMGGWVSRRITDTLRHGFSFEREAVFDTALMLRTFDLVFTEVLMTMLPLFAVLMVAALAAPISLGGFVFSGKVLALKPERMNPLKGLARMFSVHGLAELVKSVLKALVIGALGVFAVWREREHVFALMGRSLEQAIPEFFQTLLFASMIIILGLAVIALIDVPFQLWQYHRRLRMTRDEVKREHKEQEGDPHLKARIRSIQREMARRRMMAEVPKADVVVTNPLLGGTEVRQQQDGRADRRCEGGGCGRAEDPRDRRRARCADARGAPAGPCAERPLRTGAGRAVAALHRGGRGDGLCLSTEHLVVARRTQTRRADGPGRAGRHGSGPGRVSAACPARMRSMNE